VAKIREELEQDKKIPVLTRLGRKGGGTTPREFNRIGKGEQADSPFDNTPDFFDEAEAAEERARQQPREIKPPADLMSDDKPIQDGGYDVEADEAEEAELEATGPLITGLEQPNAPASGLPWQRNDIFGQGGQQRTLRLTLANEDGIPVEITLYVDGKAHSLPVTLLVTAGPIAGLPETSLAEHQQAVLVLGEELGRRLRLVY
jgi:hypothetical protein